MRFTEQMVGQRGAVVQLVRDGVLSQAQAAAELGRSVRQVRRLVRRLESGAGTVEALGYRRQHPAPNRLSAAVRLAVQAVHTAHPRWSAGAVWEEVEGQELEPLPSLRSVSRWLKSWRNAPAAARPKPARRFEAERPLDLVQMDTTSGQWLVGRRMAYVIVQLDDHSRAILAARAATADSSAANLAVLETAVRCYGPMRVLYSDNGSIFRTTRYEGSRFYVYSPEVLAGQAPTQFARAVGELGTVLLTHSAGNARAKGKLERWNRFFQERLLSDGPYPTIEALDAALQDWVERYNERHQHRTIGCVPAARLAGHQPRPLPTGARPLGDICALRETRKVAKDHTISLDGLTYALPREPNLVAFTVEVRIRPGQTVRIWHADRLVTELPHGRAKPQDGLTVDQLLHQILPQLEPKAKGRSVDKWTVPRTAHLSTDPTTTTTSSPAQTKGGRTAEQPERADILPGVTKRTF